MTLPSFTLQTAAASGTYPFTLGIGLKKGDATSIACDLSQYQVVVKRAWNDGSIKHAIISGRAALTQLVARTVTITSGTPQGGTALTASDIATAAPSASVQCGSIGTVQLAPLLEGAPVRTWISGHEMVECHYRGSVGGGTLLEVLFRVRLFADGRVWVRAVVENGFLDNGSGATPGNADRSYVPTVTIGGSTVFTNGGSTLVHRALASWKAEGWIGGDPQVAPRHDAANLRATKLVPNYSHTAPSSGALDALDQTYAPLDRAGHVQNMGATGFAGAIGLLPLWDALYCTSGDARALRACEVGAWSLRSYPVGYRGFTSKLPIKPSAFATWTPFGPFGGGSDTLGNADLTWEYNHAPSAGYLAYLLTGDYDHYETMLLQASAHYLCVDTANGQGVNRVLRRQVRGTAWALRTIGQLCAIAPDTEIQAGQIVADYRTLLANNYAAHKATIDANGTQAWSGSVYQYSYGQWTSTGSVPTWMTDFWIAANGHLSDIEPLSDATNLIAVRDHMYRWVVGRLGRSGVSAEHDFTRAGAYGLVVATDNTGATWHQSWGAVHTASHGAANTVEGNALQGSSGGAPSAAATGYWGNLLPAIACAVEHGAAGAAAAYARLTGASNWATVQASGFDDIPIWGVAPRAGVAAVRVATYTIPSGATAYIGRESELPYRLPNSNEVVNIHLNNLSDVNPCPANNCWFSEAHGMNGPYVNWCGAILAAHCGPRGSLVRRGGGHGGYNGIELQIADLATGMHRVLGSSPPNGDWLSSLDPVWGDYLYQGSYIVPADHTYSHMLYLPPSLGGGPQGSMLIMCSTYGGFEMYRPHVIDLATGVCSRYTTNTYVPGAPYGPYGSCFVDTKRGVAWGMAAIETNNHCKIDLTAGTKTIVPVSSFYVGGIYFASSYAEGPDKLLCAWSKGNEPYVNLALYEMASGTPVNIGITTTTNLPKFAMNAYSLVWHPGTGKFYVFGSAGTTTIYTLTPPADPAAWSSVPWVWGTLTPTGAVLAWAGEVAPGAAAQGGQPFTKLQLDPRTGNLVWCDGLVVRQSPDGVMRNGALQLYRPPGAA